MGGGNREIKLVKNKRLLAFVLLAILLGSIGLLSRREGEVDSIAYEGYYTAESGEKFFRVQLVVKSEDFSFDVIEIDDSGVIDPLGVKLIFYTDSKWYDNIIYHDRWGKRLYLDPGNYYLRVWAPYEQKKKKSKLVIQGLESNEFVW